MTDFKSIPYDNISSFLHLFTNKHLRYVAIRCDKGCDEGLLAIFHIK
jgi:hypothetical protein